jgi:hypothetical protein
MNVPMRVSRASTCIYRASRASTRSVRAPRAGASLPHAHLTHARSIANRRHRTHAYTALLHPLCLILALGFALTISATPASATQSTTTATIAPTLSPDRLGAQGALQLAIRYSSNESAVPLPVTRAVLRFPAGLGVEIPHLRSCSPTRLRAHGPKACPAQSLLGRGNAIAETQVGSQVVSEGIDLTLFVGPFHNLQPTFEILGQGYSPFDERVVLTGTVLPDNPPFGEDLVLTIPPIPTLSLEPDASILSMSLTVGTPKPPHPITLNTVVVPPSCPAGGFPFAAEFTYADGSTSSALASAACP